MATGTLLVLPNDSIVSIKISGAFYARLTQLIIEMASSRDKKEIREIIEMIKNDVDPTDPFAYHYITVLTLIHEIEKEAKEQGLLKEVDEDAMNQTLGADSE
jgi:hypothetical protein